jgi:hypothetical protein
MTPALCLSLLSLLLLSLTTTRAVAQAAVHVEGCAEVEPDELARLFAIELKTLGGDPALRDVHVTCEGGRVSVRAEREGDVAPLEAELELASTGGGSRTRLLALQLSELLATSQRPPPPPAPPPVVVPVVLEEHSRERPPARLHAGLSLAAGARWLGEPRAWLPGLTLAHAAPLMRSLTVRSDLSFELGQVATQLADVSVRQLTLGGAIMLTLRSTHVDVLVGPGLRCAWSWLRARDVAAQHRGKSLSAPWLGPMLAGQLLFHGRSPWQALLGVESGYVLVPIEGRLDRSEALFAVESVWLAAQLGAAYRW